MVESAGTDTLAVSDRLAQRRRYVAQYRERMIVYGRLIAAVTCAFWGSDMFELKRDGTAVSKADGTIVYAGDDTKGQEACLEWEDIIAIAMGDEYVVGLREDGTVVSTSAGNLTAGWNLFVS